MQWKLKLMEFRRDACSLDFTSKNLTVKKVIDPSLNIFLKGAFILHWRRWVVRCHMHSFIARQLHVIHPLILVQVKMKLADPQRYDWVDDMNMSFITLKTLGSLTQLIIKCSPKVSWRSRSCKYFTSYRSKENLF